MWSIYGDARPGFSSQTTTIQIENIVAMDVVNHGSFDAYSPTIESPRRGSWEEVAREVLQERADLWEKLSEL